MPFWCTAVFGVVSAFIGFWIAMAIVIMRGEVNSRFIEGDDTAKDRWKSVVITNRNLSVLGGAILGEIQTYIYYNRGRISPEFWHVIWTVSFPSFAWACLFSVFSFRRFLQGYHE